MQIFLYEWWALRRRGRICEKMSRMKVEVRKRGRSKQAAVIRHAAYATILG